MLNNFFLRSKHNRNPLRLTMTLCLLVASYTMSTAAIPQTVLPFHNNSTLSIPLSNVDINKIIVLHDKITAIHGPAHCFKVSNGKSGAIYLSLSGNAPFTLFLGTQWGQQVSLWIIPKKIIGKTVLLKSHSSDSRVRRWEKIDNYQELLISLMKGLMRKKLPTGYGIASVVHQSSFLWHHTISIKPLFSYVGNHLSGITYRIVNKGEHSVHLNPQAFYTQGVAAVALSQQKLSSKQRALLSIIINGER